MEAGITVGLIMFFVGILVGIPVSFVFLGSTILILVLIAEPMGFIAGTAYAGLDSYVLMAIGFFVFAGDLMSESGIDDVFVRLATVLVGRIRGGLVDVGIVTILFMSALTGSSVPTIAATIPLLVPRLERLGYQRRYTTAAMCSSSFLGYLIPPSVPVLMYCLVAGQSVSAVFLSTVVPGLLLAGGYMALNTFMVEKYRQPAVDVAVLPKGFKAYTRELGAATWAALPALGTPIIVLGGIYGGAFTANEAGSIAVVYTMFIGFVVYKTLKKPGFIQSIRATLDTVGMVTLLLGFGMVFTRLLTREGVAQSLASGMLGVFSEPWQILLMMNLLILVLGMFIDGIPILIVVIPLILPLVGEIGLNMVQLGAIVVVNVGLGVVTPPYAISIFVGSRLAGVPYSDLVKPMMFFLFLVGLPVLLLTTFIPALSLWLPTLAVGTQMVGAW
ncbi:MAG: TRAP transporter large permease [Dehalococcoidia bacterium]|nr:TRAP transporter large permease [Dehalococcoidia bacterium]